ncbi:MAG: cupin domain-containing protein [Planctomycetes bacterium]|nr:cupin domain-containing protein [Planctomycetota bacterium]
MQAPSSQHLALPRGAGNGPSNKEVSVLLDERHLKLATIALRNGTALPVHTAPVPVTIHVLEGEGVIHTGGKPVSVTQGSLIALVANEEHDVIPTPGSDMLLLVHYLRGAQ